jgi:histidyl-tRNA synthetase
MAQIKKVKKISLSLRKPKTKKMTESAMIPKTTQPIPQLVRGMKDILPTDQPYWTFTRDISENIANAYRFERIDTPIVEDVKLFLRAVGKQTDIAEKEIFTFIDKGGETLALRPEATASIVRAYINHGMFNLPQPVKLWYSGPMFRHDRPQAGRYRQFHQVGFEIINEPKPVADAELIAVCDAMCKDLGLNTVFAINSLGDLACRQTYLNELMAYYRSVRPHLCETCKRRLVKNPLRLLDCKDVRCVKIAGNAPQIVDFICEDCKNHFMKLLEYLDEMGISYVLDPHLVRGLDYYTRTVFEIFLKDGEKVDDLSKQNALGGGGRYDDLIESLGGRSTPACGFALGVERLISKMREKNVVIPPSVPSKVFLAVLGETAKRKALKLFEEIRRAGIRIAANFSKETLKSQLEIANKLAVDFTLILGQKEVIDETIIIRDMSTGVQEIVDVRKVLNILKKKLGL